MQGFNFYIIKMANPTALKKKKIQFPKLFVYSRLDNIIFPHGIFHVFNLEHPQNSPVTRFTCHFWYSLAY